MLYKPRFESTELRILKSLDQRMSLSEKDKQQLFKAAKGYEGELLFDALTDKLECDCLILNDLLLKCNTTTFQIDSLIITPETIYAFEVKNYEGDYYYEKGNLYKMPKTEVSNPLTQLKRSESLLRQLLQNLGYNNNIPIEAFVIFINPEFSLFQAPLHEPLILPTQINRFMKKLNLAHSKLNERHRILAEKLISHHTEDSPFMQLPPYEFSQLRKGMTCAGCHSFSIVVEGKQCVCTACGHGEPVAVAVMRSVEEFRLLFPNTKITTRVIHEWCQVVKSEKLVRRILGKNFKSMGIHQWTYYE